MAISEHPWAEELPLLYDHLWARLTLSVNDRHAPSRYPTLATVSENGMPQARTVVLRDADKQAATLAIYTDIHSEKISALRATPVAALHVWDAAEQLQIRIEANVTLLTGEAISEQWQRLPEHARSAYSSGPAPGEPIADSLAYTKTPDENAFAVLWLDIQAIEALHLGQSHRRAEFSRANNWVGQWLVP
ncbi:pyridoxamine 5'-phosphate oxidase family protein [Vreelandella populi]|uniref:Pyridoxamine 5'-phosphate oxidase n=1 Tax=Vreelandella populi TaxID=2498858 RepID=A0A3S0WN01_9GAMM|nr:pyridoxamine 5'-phosphate oxidase family protein [Halomonas populi]RUR39104.1 pyridoxamine 5'-phosphate oxidase [Halomonas populi]RUR46164.1 pyridoxamine 5'-phosphate oxidase [Halomonas populi]